MSSVFRPLLNKYDGKHHVHIDFWNRKLINQISYQLANLRQDGNWAQICLYCTVKSVLRDHCHERQPVLEDHIFMAEGPAFQCNWTCHQRPPVLRDHICMVNRVVFQDRLFCTNTQHNNICTHWLIGYFLSNSFKLSAVLSLDLQ